MSSSARPPFAVIVSIAILAVTSGAEAGPADNLLPPSPRPKEKRVLGSNDERVRRAYDGRGVAGAAFSRDGQLLVTAAGYQGMTLWEVRSGRALGHLPSPSHSEGFLPTFTPNGKQLVAANWAGHHELSPVAVWDVARRERLRSLDDDVNDTPVTALTVAPDGKTVALAAGWGRKNQALQIFFWDFASGDEIGRISGLSTPPQPRRHGEAWFQALAYSPDGRTLAVLVKGQVLLVETATGQPRSQLTFAATSDGVEERPGGIVGALAFSPDGQTLAAGCTDGAIRRFHLRSGRELPPLTGHTAAVVALAWTPDAKSIQSYGVDGFVFIWSADTGCEWKPTAGPLADTALEALWDALGSDDPLDLFGCVETLAGTADQAVPFLRKRLSPVPKADKERIDHLVEEVQKGDYNARKRAVIELRKLGAAALPALRRSQERGGYDELTRRLLQEFEALPPTAAQIRALRALGVLERVGDGEARKLLSDLADGAHEAALTIKAKTALERLGKPPGPQVELRSQTLWEDLSVEDSIVAYRAVRALANRPSTAALLCDQLKKLAAQDTFNDDPGRVAKLIGDLDSDAFAVREQARKDLRNLGRLVVPALRKALEGKPSLEMKRGLEELLATNATPPEVLRVGRAMETLELMGGPEARQALEALAKDIRVKWMRDLAGESLRRQPK